MNVYSVLFFTLFTIFINFCDGQQCDTNGARRFDTTFAKLITLGGSGRIFPENENEQLKKYCDQSFDLIETIDKYKNKCLKESPKQITGVIVYSVKTVINKYCKRDSKRRDEIINSFICANRAKKSFDQCYTTLIDKFQMAYNVPEKQRVPHTCCEYYKMYECYKDKTANNKDCNEEQVETFSAFVKELFGGVVDILCTDYVEGSDKCDKLGPLPKKKKSQRRTKSFMLPLINNIASIGE